jgi:hypothetical protein
MTHINCTAVPESERLTFIEKLFGLRYVTLLEPTVFDTAGMLAADYSGGFWEFFSLSNGGMYAAPRGDTIYEVCCQNGFEGKLSANALGLTAYLYAYSQLSFDQGAFGDLCATQYHLVREYMFQHPEASAILRAID